MAYACKGNKLRTCKFISSWNLNNWCNKHDLTFDSLKKNRNRLRCHGMILLPMPGARAHPALAKIQNATLHQSWWKFCRNVHSKSFFTSKLIKIDQQWIKIVFVFSFFQLTCFFTLPQGSADVKFVKCFILALRRQWRTRRLRQFAFITRSRSRWQKMKLFYQNSNISSKFSTNIAFYCFSIVSKI